MSTLVTGATGMVGRRVLTELTRRGLPATGASRTSRTRLDWTDTSNWDEVLKGVSSVFVVTPVGSALGSRVAGFLEKAAEAGVDRAVVMSAMGTEHAPSDSDQRAAELRAKDLFGTWTVLRPNWLFQDFTEGTFASLARSRNGRLELPVKRRTEVSFVDARDVADTAVAALLGDGHERREYTLTGPQALTFREVVKRTKGTESPVWRFKSVDEAGFYFRATNRGWGDRYIDTLNERFAAAVAGRAAEVTEGVRSALKRDPIPLARFMRESVL
ncbi:NAD(P)H-binding protein [Nocardiopsis sp. NPDC058631]|uniref:NAD(P)H-binding protein n=1 Tax=Nocardiopsis sp. NPDC058631 TaxID=3346566 RepID=UPI00364BF9DC